MNLLKSAGLIIVGIFFIVYAHKNPNKTFPAHTVGGYIGGITLILIGIMLLCGLIQLII